MDGLGGVEERNISVAIPAKAARFQTGLLQVRSGEVWRILEVVSLSRPSPDVELTLHINGVPQARVNASSVYLQNASKATADAFAKYVIGHRDEVHFVATPLVPSRDPTFVDFRLKIQTEQLV